MASQPHTVNALALVHAPRSDLLWCEAAGTANPETNEQMTSNHLFRIASVTKPFTAVVVLQLIEEERFTLDTPLTDLLSPSDLPNNRTADELLILNDTPAGAEIRVRHLLSHTSGLPDYWGERNLAGPYEEMSLLDLLLEDGKQLWTKPDSDRQVTGLGLKMWSPTDIIRFYCDAGLSHAAKGVPGDTFHYSDTNYVLLGLIIEKVSGTKLHDAFRERIYDPLGMTDTFLEWYEPVPLDRLSHNFFWIEDDTATEGGHNVNLMRISFNSSAGWAGGGLVTTAHDLNRFLRGLFAQQLFRNEETLDHMLTAREADSAELQYGLGLYRITTKSGHVGWGHFGASGVSAFVFPNSDVSIVLTRNHSIDYPYMKDVEQFVSALEQLGVLGCNEQ